jgi:hypothetical protein
MTQRRFAEIFCDMQRKFLSANLWIPIVIIQPMASVSHHGQPHLAISTGAGEIY